MTSTLFSRRLLLAAACAASLAGCASMSSPVTVADTIAQNPNLSTLNTMVGQAGLTETLKGPGPFTLFAPTNDAFKAVPAKTMDELAKDPQRLKAVLNFHLLPARLTSADVKNSRIKSVGGDSLALAKAGNVVTIEDATTVTPDIAATNGVVHVIDRVLMPPKK